MAFCHALCSSHFFLDTRTQRKYVGPLGLGQLAGPTSITWLRDSIGAHRLNGENAPIYIAAVTPVLGFVPIEFLQGLAKRILRKVFSAADLDFESWIAERDGYFELMRALLDVGVKDCVFLSGDVHYGFIKTGAFYHRGESCSILQVVSSALRNEPPASPTFVYLGLFTSKIERRVGFIGAQLRNKVRRFLRPFVYDFPVFWGLIRPQTSSGEAWYDHSGLLSVRPVSKKVMTECHIVKLAILNSDIRRVEFRGPKETEVAVVDFSNK